MKLGKNGPSKQEIQICINEVDPPWRWDCRGPNSGKSSNSISCEPLV